MITKQRNITLEGAGERPFLLDVYPAAPARGTLVFAHGFKGFKDWGHWHMLGEAFARAGYTFVAFNFSHNGTTPETPAGFADLEAFGQNNYSKELYDLQRVVDWLRQAPLPVPADALALHNLWLIGHSRGGPIALLTAAGDAQVAGLITWASVSSLAYAWPDEDFLRQWREKGRYTVINGRTGQEMPLYYQLYEDFRARQAELDVQQAARKLDKPCLIQHGTEDPAVPPLAARQLHNWISASELHLIEGADHVFGGRHPWESADLPDPSKELLKKAVAFLEERGIDQ
jgi:hypothetical protein